MNENSDFKRIMAIDFGVKRIGIALTDPLMTFAYPFLTLANDNKFWSKFIPLIKEKKVTKIILGLPLKEDGSEYELTKLVSAFKSKIELKANVEVLVRDERYTSSIAQSNLLISINKKSRRKDKSIIDQSAAAIILEDYLKEIQK